MKSLLTILLLAFAYFSSNAQSGSITNINIAQRTDGSGLVDIYFDLSGSEDAYDINIEISFNNGGSYVFISPQFLAGDINNITPGSNKHIIWNGLESFPDTYSTQSKLKIIAFENGSGGTDTFTDPRDGQTYTTVNIGSQTWFAENLNYETSNSWTFNNDPANGDIYGRLYTWEAALNACPSGWHLPSDEEWKTLEKALGMSQSEADDSGRRGTDEGGKMKEAGTAHWNSPNIGATNSSRFTALPGGFQFPNGGFGTLGFRCFWWSASSSTEISANAWCRVLYRDEKKVGRYHYDKAYNYSVRCLKD